MKHFNIYIIGLLAMLLSACDEHRDFPDISTKPGHILLTSGKVVSPEEYQKNGGNAIAVVFHTNQSGNEEGIGYAVYLWDVSDVAYSDSAGTKMNTSADMTAYDGNSNTHAMCATGVSPAAQSVFDLWKYGQSAYIPSVAQLRLLYASKTAVNPYIKLCGGDPLPDAADQCWYWSSTEVKDQEAYKSWLYSLSSGAVQETSKLQAHKVRPILTINE